MVNSITDLAIACRPLLILYSIWLFNFSFFFRSVLFALHRSHLHMHNKKKISNNFFFQPRSDRLGLGTACVCVCIFFPLFLSSPARICRFFLISFRRLYFKECRVLWVRSLSTVRAHHACELSWMREGGRGESERLDCEWWSTNNLITTVTNNGNKILENVVELLRRFSFSPANDWGGGRARNGNGNGNGKRYRQ